ncbi:MAG: ATP-binding protein [Armatimonadetes bacterium]|nr:ATP-binding protein [Armatimonadota bacterium]
MENIIKENFKLLIKEFHSQDMPQTFERDLEVPLLSNKIITIFGPRRSGKSFYFYTLIKKLLKKNIPKERILYINFEDDRLLPLSFKDLNFLLEAYFELYPENKEKGAYFFLDEIQNIKEWEIFIRRIYDKEKVKIFITGSSSKLLSKEISTHLRGRTISYALYPLNFIEFLRFNGEKPEKHFEYSNRRFKIKKLLDEYLRFGGFPEVALEKDIKLKNKILSEYFNMLIYKDLAEKFYVNNTVLLKELLRFLFTNTTSLFSVNSYFKSIKQNISISRQTLSDYLSYIQETDYIILLPLFSYSLKVQKINHKKIVCLDNGLRNVVSFKFSDDEGKMAENLVGSILNSKEKELFYWKNKHETDFIVKENSNLQAINVSIGNVIEKREKDSLFEFKNKFKKVKNLILITKDIEKTVEGIKYIPLWKWLLKEKSS